MDWSGSNFFMEILDRIPAQVFWKDRNGIYLGCNATFAKYLGYSSPKEVIGKSDYDFPVVKKDNDAFCRDDMQVIESQEPKLNFEEDLTMLNGRKTTLLTSKVPLFNKERQVIGVLGIYSDITELKKVQHDLSLAKEKAEVASQAKTNFLAMVSHELRTPLNAIIGLTQLCSEKEKNRRILPYLVNIEKSAYDLLTMVNDILDFEKLEDEKLLINPTVFNINELVSDLIKDSDFQLKNKNLLVSFTEYGVMPKSLIGDSFRIQQILQNLVSNSIKFTKIGKIEISSTCEYKSAEEVYIKFCVEDTGIGIPKSKHDEIFDHFTQVDSRYNRSFQGVGLGLSICRHLVHLMGGSIGLESEEGHGALFWFELPLKINKDEASIKLETRKIPKLVLPDNFHAKVLLVEDNIINQKITNSLLTHLNCSVDIAGNSDEAMHLVSNNAYDIIFMDIGLPGKDGIVVTQEIREYESYKDIPIIALTAFASAHDVQKFLEASLNDTLIKPITIDNLRYALHKWVVEKTL